MVDEAGDRSGSKVHIIHEVYDNENSYESFELELERALYEESNIIIIEPSRLGDETARWIAVGNCLHDTAVLSSIGAVLTGLIWTERPLVCTSLGGLSLFCAGLYTISWQFDPCVHYQVQSDLTKLVNIPEFNKLVSSSSSTVLVRRVNTRKRIFQTSVSLMAAVFCAWRLYDAYK